MLSISFLAGFKFAPTFTPPKLPSPSSCDLQAPRHRRYQKSSLSYSLRNPRWTSIIHLQRTSRAPKQISTSQHGKSDSATLNRTESVTYEATNSPALLPPFRHATSSPTSHSSHRSHRAASNPVVISCSSGRGAALTFRKVGRAEIAIRFGTNGNSLNSKFKSFTIMLVAGAE